MIPTHEFKGDKSKGYMSDYTCECGKRSNHRIHDTTDKWIHTPYEHYVIAAIFSMVGVFVVVQLLGLEVNDYNMRVVAGLMWMAFIGCVMGFFYNIGKGTNL